MRGTGWRRLAAIVLGAIVATGAGVSAGYVEKTQCRTPERIRAGWQWSHNCYSDIVALYNERGEMFRKPGYKPFSAQGAAYKDNNFEYPALTGLFVTAAARRTPPGRGDIFLRENAWGLAAMAILGGIALTLSTKRPRRILLYAVAPAMISYAFLNWDLLAVGLVAIGLFAFARRWDSAAGLMLGLGAAAKLYPAFIVPVLIVARLRERGRPDSEPADGERAPAWRAVVPLLGGAIVGFGIPNVIVASDAGVSAWWFPWKFGALRGPNIETHWSMIRHHLQGVVGSDSFWAGGGYGRLIQPLAMLMLAAAGFWIIRTEWRRPEGFRPVVVCMNVVIVFLMTNKVFSPQFALWLLPFFVLVRVPWYSYVAFVVGDLFVLGAIWSFFLHHSSFVGSPFIIVEVAVLVRYASLGLLLWAARSKGEDLLIGRGAAVGGPRRPFESPRLEGVAADV